jgi:hypothetical protein
MKTSRYFLLILLLALTPFRVAAQSPAAEPPDTTVFFIRNIDFDIKGYTRQFAILYHTEIVKGERITGRKNLEKYRLNKTQLLLNQRALEFAEIRCFEGDALEDGSVPVDLLIITEDTWNIIVLPKPQYDDNDGFELTLKGRDYNFLGTLYPLRIDLGYTLDADKVWDFSEGAFNFMIDADVPFKAFDLNWNINFDHDFAYTLEEPFYYKNTTGISLELPVSFTTFTFGFDQSTTVNEDNDDTYPDDWTEKIHGERWLPVYFTSAAYVSWKIPTPIEIGRFGKLAYTPQISTQINFLPTGEGDIDDLRRGPTATLGHRLGFGRVDWIGNYRSGLEASIGNSNTYNFYKEDWDISYDVSVIYHHIFTGFFGISNRLQYRHWLDTYTKTAGSVIRGVLDKSLYADYMLSLNMDFPLRVLRFVPSEWFKPSWLRVFNFDMHFSPFFDMVLLRDPEKNIEFWSKPVMGAGFEIIVFPHFFRSVYLRVSAGYDVNAVIRNGRLNKWNELFIGIGHYY